ncbi:MAG: hypothetical protein ACRCSN_16405 [Dermatophilaceae bacterium]
MALSAIGIVGVSAWGVRIGRVIALRTSPVRRDQPVDHEIAVLTGTGLAGDRPKKAPASLVGQDSPDTRANLVLDVRSFA